MAIRTRYSSLDMVRMAKFAKENPELKPIPLIKAYNEKYPEVTKEQKLKNIRNWLGTELCDGIDALNEKAALTLHSVSSLACLNHECGGNIGLTCRFGEDYKKCASRQT